MSLNPAIFARRVFEGVLSGVLSREEGGWEGLSLGRRCASPHVDHLEEPDSSSELFSASTFNTVL